MRRVPAGNLFDLSGRVAAITGAASGLGRAIARGFADAGADLMLADINAEALETLQAELAPCGRRVISRGVDVTKSGDVEDFHRATLAEFGKSDILVNSAGITLRTAAEDFPEADWDRILAVNLTGTFRM